MSDPILIGLTGGIGSGKSTVAKIFESLSIPVFNSDKVAKDIVNTNTAVVKEITSVFGDVYQKGILNSKKIASVVFNDANALNQLNEIVHPQVKIAFKNWVKQHATEKIVIKEAAILIETEGYKELDKIILVVASEEMKIKRVMARDRVGADVVKSRMKNQLLDNEKENLSDFVIFNDEKQLLTPQVLAIVRGLKK